jgi:hypothetical protein
VFHVMDWTPGEWERTFEALLEQGRVREVRVNGAAAPWLASTRAP